MRWKALAAGAVMVVLVSLFGPIADAAGTTHRFVQTSDTSIGKGRVRVAFQCSDRTGKWTAKVRNVIPIVPYPGNPPGTHPLQVWNNLSVYVPMPSAPSFRQPILTPGYEPGERTRGFVFVGLRLQDDGKFDGETSGVMDPAECVSGNQVAFYDYSNGDPPSPYSSGLLRIEGTLS
jgi:hypothetical protein